MKKLWSGAVVLAMVVAFGILQNGTAYSQTEGNNIEFQENFNRFLEETVNLRQDLADKQAEVQSEMFSPNPDRQKIALLYQDRIENFVEFVHVKGLGDGSTKTVFVKIHHDRVVGIST